MPYYDYKCPKCHKEITHLATVEEYRRWIAVIGCPYCYRCFVGMERNYKAPDIRVKNGTRDRSKER